MEEPLTEIRFVRNPEFISGKIDDEIVLLHHSVGKYYSMNPVATKIWELLDKPVKFGLIIKALTEEFDVDIEKCREETHEFLKLLIGKGMVSRIT